MNETLTVVWKECVELFGNRHSRRGMLIQVGAVLFVMGVLLPLSNPTVLEGVNSIAMLNFVFPSLLSATVAADAFAGERERKTMETLLATPLSDRALFLGKTLTAVCYALAVCTLALILAVVTVNVRRSGPLFLPSPGMVKVVLMGALGAASLMSAIAIFISSRVAVVRSVQQATSVLSMVLIGGITLVAKAFGLSPDEPTMLRISYVLFILGALALAGATRLFRRERFFESR